jgi:hypothetical protein
MSKQRSIKHYPENTRDRSTRTPQTSAGELRCSEGYAVPAPLVAHVVLLQLQTR